jgi:hypothetical protein
VTLDGVRYVFVRPVALGTWKSKIKLDLDLFNFVYSGKERIPIFLEAKITANLFYSSLIFVGHSNNVEVTITLAWRF